MSEDEQREKRIELVKKSFLNSVVIILAVLFPDSRYFLALLYFARILQDYMEFEGVDWHSQVAIKNFVDMKIRKIIHL